MKIVTDCNVIISAGLNNGISRQVLLEILSYHENFINDDIIREYRDVILRPKFNKFREALIEILENICLNSTWITGASQKSEFTLPDPYDQMYLDLALDVKANLLVTGNGKDFPEQQYESTRIISPKEFVEKYKLSDLD